MNRGEVNGPVRESRTEDMIEITSEMIDAGKTVVEKWFLENGDIIYENGGKGNIHSLLTALWESWKKDL